MTYETTRDFVPWEDVNDFDAAVEMLLLGIAKKYSDWMPDSYRKCVPIVVDGRKFVKVIEDGSVWGFIAKADGEHKGLPMVEGDVFKAASWSAAAKHVRGNIFDVNKDWYRWTGPNYL